MNIVIRCSKEIFPEGNRGKGMVAVLVELLCSVYGLASTVLYMVLQRNKGCELT